MNDTTTTLAELKKLFSDFVRERNWQQFQTPKNLAMNLACEAAELMELFVWVESAQSAEVLKNKSEDVHDELADIALSLLLFCAHNNIDLTTAIKNKMAKNIAKYPVEKSYGKATKYTDL
jgi:dCTP diphosphatase